MVGAGKLLADAFNAHKDVVTIAARNNAPKPVSIMFNYVNNSMMNIFIFVLRYFYD